MGLQTIVARLRVLPFSALKHSGTASVIVGKGTQKGPIFDSIQDPHPQSLDVAAFIFHWDRGNCFIQPATRKAPESAAQ